VQWTVHVNGSPRAFASRQCRVTATVADADGAVLAQTAPQLPWQCLARGCAVACWQVDRAVAGRPELRGTDGLYAHLDANLLAEAVVSTMSLVQVAQHDTVLAPLLWQVVQRPSLWSLVTGLGAHIVVRPRFHECQALGDDRGGAGPCWRLPIDVAVNDTPALRAELVVAAADPPRALCAGIVAAVARHPVDPGIAFTAVLLAARRGPVTLVGDQRSFVSGSEIALDKR
jgi:hypothetical protein